MTPSDGVPFAARGPEAFPGRSGSVPLAPRSQVLLVLALATVGSLLTANPLLSAGSVLAASVLFWLLWRPGEPPVLLLAAGFQWLQVSLKVWHANALNLAVQDVSPFRSVESAIWLGLAGLVVLAIGMRAGMLGLRVRPPGAVRAQVTAIPVERVFAVYAALALVGVPLQALAWRMPGAVQPLLALIDLRWVFFFVLGYLAFSVRRGRRLFLGAAAFEFISGVGFFSDFRTVLFLSLLVALTLAVRFTWRTWVVGVAGAVALLFIGVVWSAIKNEYRTFLSQGERAQVVVVSPAQQVSEAARMAGDLSVENLKAGMVKLVLRVAYVDYFARVLEYVPQNLPHTDGRLWGGAVVHALTPRLLFPGKPGLPGDSEVTRRYTGLDVAGAEVGTSISLGYVTESYIDFGYAGMWAPILVVGMLWGVMYHMLIRVAPLTIFGYGSSAALFLHAIQFELAGAKVVGGVLMKFIVFLLFLRFVMPWTLRRVLRLPRAADPRWFAGREPVLLRPPTGG